MDDDGNKPPDRPQQHEEPSKPVERELSLWELSELLRARPDPKVTLH
jgi:hypothetical protein